MGTDTNKLKLYYNLSNTYTDNETIINSDGSFSFNIGPLSLPATSIRIFVGYKSPDNPAQLVFAGFREITLTTQAPPVSPPSTPTGFNVTAASSSQINLAWTASTGSVEGYKIYRDGTYLKYVTTTSTSDTGLSPSTTYCYSVTAYNAAGETTPGSQACATTQATTAPAGPVPFTLYGSPQCSGSSSQIILSGWSTNAGESYDVYRNGSRIAQSNPSNEWPVFTNTSVTAGTTYLYYVVNRNAYGSTTSNTISVTAPTCGGTLRTGPDCSEFVGHISHLYNCAVEWIC